ncbi:CAP domain-containing protein [Aridibaculum aurantiacum]|uniref:CAP domain-containing protein n=1 Tax=Aridibaculum aurantiacum TaxID=2810307 RepID=UPI001A95883F
MKPLFFLLLLAPVLSFGQHFSTSTIEVRAMPNMPARDLGIEAFLYSFPETKSMPADVREWFYWTNFSRSKPRVFWDSVVAPILSTHPNLRTSYAASLKKDLYATGPLEMLKPNAILSSLAQAHANELKKRNAPPSHTSPSGATFQDRMVKGGIEKCAGENISFGPSNTILALVFLYIDEGIPDLGHRKSLLNSSYKEMGVGISAYNNGSFMVIQDFSCLQ